MYGSEKVKCVYLFVLFVCLFAQWLVGFVCLLVRLFVILFVHLIIS